MADNLIVFSTRRQSILSIDGLLRCDTEILSFSLYNICCSELVGLLTQNSFVTKIHIYFIVDNIISS